MCGSPLFSALVSKLCVPRPLLFQALQKDKMAEAYSEIGIKGEVSADSQGLGQGGDAPREALLTF